MPVKQAKAVAKSFTKAPVEKHPAKDLRRSAGLTLLAADDPAVVRDLAKVRSGQMLSPVLIVRGDSQRGIHAVIADGFHRVCASYHLSENELILCRIIDHPK